MKIIVGLGNPGKKYLATRHNVGFMVVDKIVADKGLKLKRSLRLNAYTALGSHDGQDFVCVKPLTFMNNSGLSVNKALRRYKSDYKDLIVVYDDVDLSLGKVKCKQRGSSAGHRGMESIFAVLGTNKINRVRVGIGKKITEEDLSQYVLSSFLKEEKEIINSAVEKAVVCCFDWLDSDIENAMQKHNNN